MSQDSVRAHLLGAPHLTRNGRSVSVPPSSLRLLAYLLTRPGRRATRAQLMDALGEDAPEPTARRRVNTAVWRLRCALSEDGVACEEVVASTGAGLAIASGCTAWVDVEEFDEACRVPRSVADWTAGDAEAVRDGLANYAGDFLEGWYDDWALAERARLAEVHVSALLRMVHWHERCGQPEPALAYAQAAAGTEPLREDLQRLLMRQYRRAGLPEMAVHHYESFRLLLLGELGVQPLPETREAGLGAQVPVPRRAGLPRGSLTMREVLAELEHTREELRLITSKVEHSISVLRGEIAGPASRR